ITGSSRWTLRKTRPSHRRRRSSVLRSIGWMTRAITLPHRAYARSDRHDDLHEAVDELGDGMGQFLPDASLARPHLADDGGAPQPLRGLGQGEREVLGR